MDLRKYKVPEIVYGDKSIELVAKYAKNYNAEKIMVVTDQGIIDAGWIKVIEDILNDNHLKYIIYKNVTPNPKDFEVNKGAQTYLQENCNLLIAVGGGSVLDCAKGIGIVCTNKEDINNFEGVDNIRIPMPPLICVPTTAGSAADISQFAIILNTSKRKKIAIISKALVPDVSIIDGITTTTMSKELTANTGMDALVHGIEAYVSNASSTLTNIHALEAINLISKNLINAVKEPYNMMARNNMIMGCTLAGIAFSNASLGIIHAMAHSLGGLKDLPHGECNAILLEHCIEFNFESCPDKYKDVYIAMGGDPSIESSQIKSHLIEKINQLSNSIGIADSFEHYHIRHNELEEIAINAYNDPCIVTNPRNTEVEDIKMIFEKLIK